MTWANALALSNFIIGIAVLLVALGRWGGKLESRGKAPRSATEPVPAWSQSPSEIARRFEELQAERRAEVRKDLEDRLRLSDETNRREHEDLWGAVKGLRETDAALARRVDGLMDHK